MILRRTIRLVFGIHILHHSIPLQRVVCSWSPDCGHHIVLLTSYPTIVGENILMVGPPPPTPPMSGIPITIKIWVRNGLYDD